MRWYIDPAQLLAGDCDEADVLFITHEHGDHYSPKVTDVLRTTSTLVRGAGLLDVLPDLVNLYVITMILLAVATLRFRKSMA